jgi:hypothetical protein
MRNYKPDGLAKLERTKRLAAAVKFACWKQKARSEFSNFKNAWNRKRKIGAFFSFHSD